MRRTMFWGRDSTGKKQPLLPLSLARHSEEDDNNFSFFAWFRQLCIALSRRFRFGAENPLPGPNLPNPINFSNSDNQHCVVDVVEIEEPILENTVIGGDEDDFSISASTVIGGNEDDEIGIERSVMAVEEVHKEEEVEPVPVQPPATKSEGKKEKKQSVSLGPYSREQSIPLVGEGDFSFSASTVNGGDAEDEIGIERSVMAVEEVQKEEEPVPVQPPSTKSKSKKKRKKKQSASLGPYSSSNLNNQHFVVDVVEIEEPILKSTGIRRDVEDEIGIERLLMAVEEVQKEEEPVPVQPPSSRSKMMWKKKQSASLGPYSSSNLNNQHFVDVVEIEEPILESTGMGRDVEDEIGIERSMVEVDKDQKEEPVSLPVVPPQSTKSKGKKEKKQSVSLGPYSREQSILLVGEGDFSFSACTGIGGDAEDEIGIERSVMAEPEVQKEEPVPVQPPSTKSKRKKNKKQSASLGPYNREMKILLVGEGDFSFSASLAVAFGDAPNIVATSLNSFKFLKKNYTNAATNITELTSRGCKVIHCIDATKMARHHELRSLKFDCIVYNFPHAGFDNLQASRKEQISKHQELVIGFLKNAKKMIKEDDGQIHITHKCSKFFLKWDLETLGSSQGLRLVQQTPFNPKHYPGYATKYGYGGDGDFDWNPSKTYKFQLSA